MPSFEIETQLTVSANELAYDALTMLGVIMNLGHY